MTIATTVMLPTMAMVMASTTITTAIRISTTTITFGIKTITTIMCSMNVKDTNVVAKFQRHQRLCTNQSN